MPPQRTRGGGVEPAAAPEESRRQRRRALKAKDAFFELLASAGVRHLFGNPGTTEVGFLDALLARADVEYIVGLQESVPIGMAEAYARASGSLAVVNVHATPGLCNALSGLFNAYVGGTPLLVTAGLPDTRLHLQEPILYSDLERLARPYTKWCADVGSGSDLLLALRRAVKEATTPPRGPVLLSASMNVLEEEVEGELLPLGDYRGRTRPERGAMARAAQLLLGARQPVVLVGDRVGDGGAMAGAVRVAELLGAPVYSGLNSVLNFPTDHPQFLGRLSTLEAGGVRRTLEGCDLLLALGCEVFRGLFYGPGGGLPPGTRLVQIDSDPWELGKNHPAALAVLCDLAEGLEELACELEGQGAGQPASGGAAAAGRLEACRGERERQQAASDRAAAAAWDRTPIAVPRLLRELQAAMAPDAALVVEASTPGRLVFQHMRFSQPGSYFAGRGGGGLGWGMPGALGVKLAVGARQVVALIGDGSAMYCIQALWTAAHHRIPVTYVIANNSSYQILKTNWRTFYGAGPAGGAYPGFDLVDPPLNFAGVARAYGLPSWCVERPDELGPALRQALAVADRATLVEVLVEGGE